MANFSILKVVNTTATSTVEAAEKTKKHILYITRPEAVKNNLLFFDKVRSDNMLQDFGRFRVQKEDTGRPLKHIVISFGCQNPVSDIADWKTYLEATVEITQYYLRNHQIIAAVHDNIPTRPHAHILVDCFNITTGKKLSEGPAELKILKSKTNDILSKFNIPLIRMSGKPLSTVQEMPDVVIEPNHQDYIHQSSVFYEPDSSYYPYNPIDYHTQNSGVQPAIINNFFINISYSTQQPPLETIYEILCAKCQAPLTEKERRFCYNNRITPPICYRCQHQLF